MPLIEVYDNSGNPEIHRAISRKLALVLFYLNQRTEMGQNGQFRHGGVWGKTYPSYNYPQNGPSFVVVVDRNYVINTANYLADNRLGDNDIRASCEMLSREISRNAEYGYLTNLRYVSGAPLLVGGFSTSSGGSFSSFLSGNIEYIQGGRKIL